VASYPPANPIVRAQPLAGMPGPRWNRSRAIYPSHVHTWLDCPRRARLQYVDSVRVPSTWNRKIEVGNAFHKVMEEIANSLRLRQPVPGLDTFRPRLERLLPAREYESSEMHTLADRRQDVENVLTWAARAQTYIADPGATMARIEKYYPRDWDTDPELGPVKLGAKADLVMKRHDRNGAFIEIVDYKTGRWQRTVDFAPALSRISHKPQIHALLRNNRFPRVVFTYLWLAREETIRIEMTRDHMLEQWRELRRVLIRMVHDDTWPMRPDPATCRHCPYFNTACFPTSQGAAADPGGIDLSELARLRHPDGA
jgi:hypothetical protein